VHACVRAGLLAEHVSASEMARLATQLRPGSELQQYDSEAEREEWLEANLDPGGGVPQRERGNFS